MVIKINNSQIAKVHMRMMVLQAHTHTHTMHLMVVWFVLPGNYKAGRPMVIVACKLYRP